MKRKASVPDGIHGIVLDESSIVVKHETTHKVVWLVSSQS
jgi:hypothetical protein